MASLYLQGISLDELEALIERKVQKGVKDAFLSLPCPPTKDNSEVFLTRHETAQRLGVSLVTLHRWSVEGVVQSYRIGTRIRYKQQEVEAALQQVQNLKYKRG